MASGNCQVCGAYRARLRKCKVCGKLLCGICSYDPFWSEGDKSRYCLAGCVNIARKERKEQAAANEG